MPGETKRSFDAGSAPSAQSIWLGRAPGSRRLIVSQKLFHPARCKSRRVHPAAPVAHHVAMGATLFRREALEQVRFSWRGKQCECQCCCDDLRRRHWAIDYYSSAKANHLPKTKLTKTPASGSSAACPSNEKVAARVLTGFNRRHFGLFCARFLTSLRASGNQDVVIPFAIGLYPSERRRLAAIPGVRPV